MDRAYLKQMAKAQIKGNVGILFVITLLVAVLSYLSGMIIVASLVVIPTLSLATVSVYLNLTRGVKPEIIEIFRHFGEFWSALKVTLLTSIFTFLWALLLIVPGIVKAIGYSQAMYILAENPNIGAGRALKKSEEMMNGHKLEYVVLQLSFLGWILLGTLTFGLAFIWVIPYMQATQANFYNSIKNPARAM